MKLFAILAALVGATALVSSGAPSAPPHPPIDPVSIVVPQQDAPLKITNYKCRYQERGRYSSEGIRHEVFYQNTTKKTVVAVQIGLVSFDVWNEFLDRTGGVAIEDLTPESIKQGTWVARALSDFSFLTGVAYVSRVRFQDGEIWKADLDKITQELRKIEEGFDVKNLKDKKDQ